jgi:hypothetical protein
MPPAPSLFGNVDTRDMIVLVVVFLTLVVLAVMRRLPEPWMVKHYLSAINDRGGNIVVLALMSAWFFSISVRIFYYSFELLSQKKLEADNAILLMAVQFVTSSAFGSSFGALLKTMTGSDSSARGTDGSPGTRSTTTTVTSASTPPSPVAPLPAIVVVPAKADEPVPPPAPETPKI